MNSLVSTVSALQHNKVQQVGVSPCSRIYGPKCFQFTETGTVYFILAHMATHLKKHWKKYGIGTLVIGLGTSYLAKRLRYYFSPWMRA